MQDPSLPTWTGPRRTVVVYEGRPRWAPELQRQFGEEDVWVRSCRSAADLERMAADSSTTMAVLVLDLDASPAACLQFLGWRMETIWPGRPVIAVGSTRLGDLEWPIRELGAVEVLFDSPGGQDLARVCRRQWQVVEG